MFRPGWRCSFNINFPWISTWMTASTDTGQVLLGSQTPAMTMAGCVAGVGAVLTPIVGSSEPDATAGDNMVAATMDGAFNETNPPAGTVGTMVGAAAKAATTGMAATARAFASSASSSEAEMESSTM
jgi:hypothetical protein